MNPLTDNWTSLAALLEKYGLELPAPAKPETPIRRIPVIGPFSAGKSSLLNTLTDMELLPVGLTATTYFPTELRYGENVLRVHRDGVIQTAGLGELRRLDPAGVTRLEVLCDAPFLRRIPGLLLVDTPGLDSTAAQETLLRDELKTCGGCVLIFPADDPVMKPGTAAALAGLPEGTPVLAFLNKCDKLLQDELEASAEFLRASLEKLPGLKGISVARVSAIEKETEPFRKGLLALQARSREQEHAAQIIRGEALSLRRYLRLRLEARGLMDASAEERTAALGKMLDRLRKLMAEERAHFDEKLKNCLLRTEEQLTASVSEIALPLEMLLGSGKNPSLYVENFFREAVTSCYQRDFLPDARGYLQSIGALLWLRSYPDSPEPPVDGASSPPHGLELRLGDDPFPGVAEMLAQTLMGLNCLSRSKKREAARAAAASLLPALGKLVSDSAAKILRRQADSLLREAETLLQREETLAEKAFAAPLKHTEEEATLRADLDTLETILGNC